MSGFQIRIDFATKHRYDTYMGGNLELMFGLDLSENELSGEIPVELGGLQVLQSLNLSHNNLSGVIPESFSVLKNVESLDLSFNRLQGRIPQELTELSSLAVFNVSYNNLSGVIPQGKQFNTFDTQSYLGNHLLCGKPTNRSCNGNNTGFQESDNEVKDDESRIDMVSLYWSLGAAYVTVLVGIFASLSFGYIFCCVNSIVIIVFYYSGFAPGIRNTVKVLCCSKYLDLAWLSYMGCCVQSYKQAEIRILNLSGIGFSQFNGFFDDVEGYKSLRKLRNLEILDLSSNQFNNSIFPFLNAATSLTTLFLRNNYMGGPLLIKELKNLTNLELLDLSGNGYNGSMPEFTHLRKLKALDLSFNDFSELQELKNLTNLELLDLSGNGYNGSMPEFTHLRKLKALDLSFNAFSELQELKNLTNLEVLGLAWNYFWEPIPIEVQVPIEVICELKNLRELDLQGNNFVDNNFEGLFSLKPLANLTKLKVFKLSSTSDMVEVESESTWQPKFQLRVAELPFCSLEKIPNFFVSQKKLRVVDLSSNRLSGDIPTWLLENNPELKVLLLKNNSFTIFPISTIVHKLQVLDFSANDISGVLPDNIGHVLPNLAHMNGTDNREQSSHRSYSKLDTGLISSDYVTAIKQSLRSITGPIPVTLLENAKILDLRNNKLCGSIPEFVNTGDMRIFLLRGNSLTGSIPVKLCDLSSIGLLDLSDNKLNGIIPSCLYNLSFGRREEERMSGSGGYGF
ncbi:hypothetical protein AALP_AA2G178900, partial [Arabis alpina]